MKRSKFSLSHYRLLSMKMGQLIPLGITEVLPGDTIQQNTSLLVRSLQLLAPLMHPVSVKVHHWFVPHRLVWTDFEDFITGGPDGLNASVFPTITVSGTVTITNPGSAQIGSLADYLGTQAQTSGTQSISALPFRGYALIYNEWYRDADLMAAVPVSLASGVDATTGTLVLNAAWEKDYFTSSRPTAKKGPSTQVPITGYSPVHKPFAAPWTANKYELAAGGTTGAGDLVTDAGSTAEIGALDVVMNPGTSSTTPYFADHGAGTAELSVAALRESLALQRYQEARSRYGSRYTEYLRYLSIKSSDARLQIPEYLGGGRSTLQFSEVLQTAEGTNAVGTMRGHGISAMRTNRYRRFFEEHGYIFSLCCVRPKTVYTQGIPRHWNRRTKEDFWQRELEHIGQQEVLNKEVYSLAASPDATFGYQDRYDEYRRAESGVSGEFRTLLNFWHMARDFSSTPSLNSAFVTSVPTTRVYPVTTNDTLYIMANHSIQARRLVTRNATPRTF